MRPAIYTTAHFTLALLASAAFADEHTSEEAGIFPPKEMRWQDGPKSLPAGAKMAILEGDPAKEGPFVFRLRLPDGYKVPLHTHPKTERVTVFYGTFNIVMGENGDPKAAKKMPAGSFGHWPAGMKHYVWVEKETEVQFHGIGPWTINYVNPADDPRKQKSGARAKAPTPR
jgi:hypothetical protein